MRTSAVGYSKSIPVIILRTSDRAWIGSCGPVGLELRMRESGRTRIQVGVKVTLYPLIHMYIVRSITLQHPPLNLPR